MRITSIKYIGNFGESYVFLAWENSIKLFLSVKSRTCLKVINVINVHIIYMSSFTNVTMRQIHSVDLENTFNN